MSNTFTKGRRLPSALIRFRPHSLSIADDNLLSTSAIQFSVGHRGVGRGDARVAASPVLEAAACRGALHSPPARAAGIFETSAHESTIAAVLGQSYLNQLCEPQWLAIALSDLELVRGERPDLRDTDVAYLLRCAEENWCDDEGNLCPILDAEQWCTKLQNFGR